MNIAPFSIEVELAGDQFDVVMGDGRNTVRKRYEKFLEWADVWLGREAVDYMDMKADNGDEFRLPWAVFVDFCWYKIQDIIDQEDPRWRPSFHRIRPLMDIVGAKHPYVEPEVGSIEWQREQHEVNLVEMMILAGDELMEEFGLVPAGKDGEWTPLQWAALETMCRKMGGSFTPDED